MATGDHLLSDERAPWPDLPGHDNTDDALHSERAPSPDVFNDDIEQEDSNQEHQSSPDTESTLPLQIEKNVLLSSQSPEPMPSDQRTQQVATHESLTPKLLEDGYTSASKTAGDRRICGIKRKVVFFLLLAVIVIGAVVGGAVGGTRISSKPEPGTPTEPTFITSMSVPVSTKQTKSFTSSSSSESPSLAISVPASTMQTKSDTSSTPSGSPMLSGLSPSAESPTSSVMSRGVWHMSGSLMSTTTSTTTTRTTGSSSSSASTTSTEQSIFVTSLSATASSLFATETTSSFNLVSTSTTEALNVLPHCPSTGSLTGCCITWVGISYASSTTTCFAIGTI
ncbi:hypothetical protein V1505DRAFT_396134 [Lipomyces doorenjongii]